MDFIFFANIIALLFSFFVGGALIGAIFSKPFRGKIVKVLRLHHRPRHPKRLQLTKSMHNPILRPGTHPWTAEAVLNPTAIVLDGRTHLIYRAVGMDGVSRLGYASSADGIVFDKNYPYPIFTARSPRFSGKTPSYLRHYSPTLYPSGGSWGGTEDPRVSLVDGRVYVTFNMFDGWDFIRVAAISMSEADFAAGHFWKWKGPTILSKPGQRHKNWVIFPEKIHGKFAILHSIAPKVDIAYRDSIEDIGTTEPFIESWTGARVDLPVRENVWDSYIRSAGPPPVKTDRGWLLFYHAIDKREPNKYKLGVLLLDLDDPTKVLRRATMPVLSPDAPYENEGKPGIVYAGGAVIRNGKLFIYYGGADKVVCVATAPLHHFVEELLHEGHPTLESMPLEIV